MASIVTEAFNRTWALLRHFPPHLLVTFFLFTLVGAAVTIYFALLVLAPHPRDPVRSETLYRTLSEKGTVTEPERLPCWKNDYDTRKRRRLPKDPAAEATIEPAELFMSVVVPAYNEEERLGGMLEEAVNYLEKTWGTIGDRKEYFGKENGDTLRERVNKKMNGAATPGPRGWELIIVSDGSTDKTMETAFNFARDHQLEIHPKARRGPWTPETPSETVQVPPGAIRVVSLEQNRGKGGAVTHGMRHCRGEYIVFADADGASRFDDLGKLVEACKKVEDAQSRGVAVGSRAHLVGSEAVVKRSKLRNFLMYSFHTLLKLLTPPKTAAIKDTQCGFKLFSRASLPYIVPYMHSEGWIFDVEMLMLAEFAKIPVAEVPVGWREVKGSKLNVVWDSLGMAYGLALLRLCWGLGVYQVG